MSENIYITITHVYHEIIIIDVFIEKKTIPEWKTIKNRIFWLKVTRRLFITTRAALRELKILKNRRNGVNGEI